MESSEPVTVDTLCKAYSLRAEYTRRMVGRGMIGGKREAHGKGTIEGTVQSIFDATSHHHLGDIWIPNSIFSDMVFASTMRLSNRVHVIHTEHPLPGHLYGIFNTKAQAMQVLLSSFRACAY